MTPEAIAVDIAIHGGPERIAELAVDVEARGGVRHQIGFHASTPAYRFVLAHHGWDDLHAEAHALTKADR